MDEPDPKIIEKALKIISDLQGTEDCMNQKELGFYEKMYQRASDYGVDMFCSQKQLDWLESLEEKYVQNARHP